MKPEQQERPKPSVRSRLFRWMVVLIALALLVIGVLAGFIGYNLVRPLPKPRELPLSTLKPRPSAAEHPTSSTLASLPTPPPAGDVRTIPASTPIPAKRRDAATTVSKPVLELIAEAGQPTPERRAAAGAINDKFAQVLEDYDQFVAIYKKFPGQEDKSAYERWYLELRANCIPRYNHLRDIVAQLQKDFPSDLDRFEALYLGMVMEHKDWAEAVNYCDRVRHDWKRSLYYNRQAENWIQRSLGVGILGLRATIRSIFPGSP